MQESLERASRLITDLEQVKAARPCLPPVASASVLEATLARAVHFLETGFYLAGDWSDFQLIASGGRDWITAYVGLSLLPIKTVNLALMTRVGQLLQRDCYYPSGGWGYRPGVPVDADSTSWAVLFLKQSGYPFDLIKGVEVILAHQDPADGGFRTYAAPEAGIRQFIQAGADEDLTGWCSSHLCVTCTALLALHAVGLPVDATPVRRGLAFMRERQLAEGYWNSYWYRGRTFGAAQAIRVLCEADDASDVNRLARARVWLEDGQLSDGSWDDGITRVSGKVIDTAMAVRALLDLPAPPRERIARGIQWLLTRQRADGSWNSSPILQVPPASDHAPWERTSWADSLDTLREGICVPDRSRFFTTATVLQTLGAWDRYLSSRKDF